LIFLFLLLFNAASSFSAFDSEPCELSGDFWEGNRSTSFSFFS